MFYTKELQCEAAAGNPNAPEDPSMKGSSKRNCNTDQSGGSIPAKTTLNEGQFQKELQFLIISAPASASHPSMKGSSKRNCNQHPCNAHGTAQAPLNEGQFQKELQSANRCASLGDRLAPSMKGSSKRNCNQVAAVGDA